MNTNLKSNLIKLISHKTVSGLDSQDKVLDLYGFVSNEAEKYNLKVEKVNSNGFNNLIVSTNKKNLNSIILTAHVDVVPAKEYQFKATTEDNKLYGRGASDMKFAVACFLEFFKDVHKVRNHNIKFILTSDEEIGGTNGIKYLYENHYFDTAKVVILPDGGSNFDIVTKEKGIFHLRITAKGKSTHASRPFEGDNAIDKLICYYEKIKLSFNDFSKSNWVNTLNASKISAGTAINVVPDVATMDIDIRFTEDFTINNIKNLLTKDLSDDISLEILATGNSVGINFNDPYIEKLRKIIEKHTGHSPNQALDYGASDARHLVDLNIPIIMFKPICDGHHSDNEWIDIKSLEDYYTILKDFLLSIS